MQHLENERLKAKMTIEQEVMMAQIELRNNDLKDSHKRLERVEEELIFVEDLRKVGNSSADRLAESAAR